MRATEGMGTEPTNVLWTEMIGLPFSWRVRDDYCTNKSKASGREEPDATSPFLVAHEFFQRPGYRLEFSQKGTALWLSSLRLLRVCSVILVFVGLRGAGGIRGKLLRRLPASSPKGLGRSPSRGTTWQAPQHARSARAISFPSSAEPRAPGCSRPGARGKPVLRLKSAPMALAPDPLLRPAGAAAIQLFNQSYWAIRNVETTGGNPHGIHISGNTAATLRYFRISNVTVHDVRGVATTTQSGLIEISPEFGSATIIDDVIVDGATVFNTRQWKGIHVGCKSGMFPAPNAGSIIIRNSRASNVAGDGITIYACRNGLIENNVVYDVGTAAGDAWDTPNAIWTWACADCVVQFNEGYRSHSPRAMGGSSTSTGEARTPRCNTTMGTTPTGIASRFWRVEPDHNEQRRSVQRLLEQRSVGSLFSGRHLPPDLGGGSLEGGEIYNNTVYWNPAVPSRRYGIARIRSWDGPRFFKNNIIYSRRRPFISTDANLPLDHNLYWVPAATKVGPGQRFLDLVSVFPVGDWSGGAGTLCRPRAGGPERSV